MLLMVLSTIRGDADTVYYVLGSITMIVALVDRVRKTR